jgi:hypothetical protein
MEFDTNNAFAFGTSPTQTSRFAFNSADFNCTLNGSSAAGAASTVHTWTYSAFSQVAFAGMNVAAAVVAVSIAPGVGSVPMTGRQVTLGLGIGMPDVP